MARSKDGFNLYQDFKRLKPRTLHDINCFSISYHGIQK